MQYTFINTEQALVNFCQQASQAAFVAVDTEFVRTRTLYPQLGLIQLYDGKDLVLVDPLAIDDVSSLKDLLTDPNVVKVLHSCSEDLETFWHAFKIMPHPIFDSQFAASIIGMGASLGYAKLVDTMLGVTVDKGESRTDWLARPLRPEQCVYAANDVLFLYQLYPELLQKVEAQQKLSWVYSEIANLASKKQKLIPLETVYLGFKNSWKLSGKSILILKELAAWRTSTARKRDMALNFVVREENLLEIARQEPTSLTELRAISGVNPHEVRIHGQALLDIVEACGQVDSSDYPRRVERLNDFDDYKNTVVSIRNICIQVAEQLDVPLELVGSKKQINQLMKWCWFEQDDSRIMGLVPDLINGWRREFFIASLNKLPALCLAHNMAKEQG
jgi:ribonuclease D